MLNVKTDVLVAGGTGFLGSHLSRRLADIGRKVLIIDKLHYGRTSETNKLLAHPNITFEEHDIRIPLKCSAELIFNFACPASPIHYQKDPIFTLETTFLGTSNLLKISKDNGAVLFQASTSEIYGDPIQHPQSEEYWGNVNPIGVRACYDEAKRCAETLCFDYHRTFGTDVRVGRIFNTYGPGMRADDGRVVSNFIIQALQNKPITIYGNGEQTRSFCFVDDLINGILGFMNVDCSTNVVNLGNPHEISITQLAKDICRLTESSSKLEYLPLPKDDPTQRRPDIRKINQLTNWLPKVKLEEGLIRTIDFFKLQMELNK